MVIAVPPNVTTSDAVGTMAALFRVQAEMLIGFGIPRDLYLRQLAAVAGAPDCDPVTAYVVGRLADFMATPPGGERGPKGEA